MYSGLMQKRGGRSHTQRIERKYHLPNCPMIRDGTFLHVSLMPELQDAADDHGRKLLPNSNVLNDDKMRIRAYAGFPGSRHDNCVWNNMIEYQYQVPEIFFSPMEYAIYDTAYEPTSFCVRTLKCVSGDGLLMHHDKTLFNTILAKPRVGAEHTMGLW